MSTRKILMLVLVMITGLAFIAPNLLADDRGRVLTTTEQQYFNMVKNGSVESFSAGTTVAPDGFAVAGVGAGTGSVARDATAKFDTYSAKVTQTNATDTYAFKYDTAVSDFGTSLTGSSADLATTEWQKLTLYSSSGYVASVWVKLPGGASNPEAITLKSDTNGKVYVEIDSNAADDFCYVDGLQITQGPLAPAFVNYALTDTGDQVIRGNITIQDPASANYVQMSATGTLSVGANVSLTSTGTLDLGTNTLDDTKLGDLTDGGSTTLHYHTGLAPAEHANAHMTGDDKVLWDSLYKGTGDDTKVTEQITADIGTHAGNASAHHSPVTVSGAGLDLSTQQVALDVAPDTGNATLLQAEDALQVKYSGTHFTETAGNGLELASSYADGSAFDARFINVSGTEAMEGPLSVSKTYASLSGTDVAMTVSPTINQTGAGNASYTGLLVKATETALTGYSGTKLLLDLQAGASPTSKLTVDNAGALTTVSNIVLSTAGATVDGVDLDAVLTSLTAGSGIQITDTGHGRTVTNTNLGSSQNIFKNITDGSATAASEINDDTFKLRSANNMLDIAVANDDVTHGDNALFTVNAANIDHGSIGGLGDDDHTQYGALAQNETVTGEWAFTGDTSVGTGATTSDVFTVRGENLTEGNLIKGRINDAATTANIMKVTDDAGTPVEKFVIDKTGAITVGTIPFGSVSSKPNFVNSVTGTGGVTPIAQSSGDVTISTSVNVTDTTAVYSSGNSYSLAAHMQSIGSGTITADNPHGINYADVGASQSGHNHDASYINDGAGEIDNTNDFNFGASTKITNLDADFLDGQTGTYYLDTSATSQTKSGALTIQGNVTMGDNASDTVVLASQSAGDGTVVDSPMMYLRGNYDSNPAGGALTNTPYDATIRHNMTDTAPTSSIDFDIAGGSAEMSLSNAGNLTVLGTINGQTIGASSTLAALTANGDLIVNQNSGTPNDVYFAVQHNSGNVFTIDKDGDATIEGDLTVNGTQTILNVQTVEVESNELVLNRNVTDNPALNAAITVNRGTAGGVDRSIRWNETSDAWEVSNDGSTYIPLGGDITASYLVNSGSSVLTNEIVTSSLTQNLDIKGDASTRTITFGKSAGNSDIINLDVIDANLRVRNSQISAANLSDGANIAHINAAETLSGNWDNTANPWADNEVANDLTISGGTINNTIIGGSQAAAATVTNLTASGTLDFPNDSVAMADINWNAAQILINPEYPNASLYGDGTNNNGTLSLNNTADANFRNYYEWSSQEAILQDYTIIERHVLPSDFASWTTNAAITLSFVTETDQTADNKVDISIYEAGNGTDVYSDADNVSTGWTNIQITADNLGSGFVAGDIVIVKITVHSKNGNFVRIGDIALNYNR